jgi:hypothetical protein
MKKRADQVRVGDRVDGSKVERIREFGPMLGEAYGYARNVDIYLAPNGAWMIGPSLICVRGDILLNVE